MKIKVYLQGFLALLFVGSISHDTAIAQNRPLKQKNKQMYSRNYDVDKVETIEGEVTEVVYQPGKKQQGVEGVHLVVKAANETIAVHLGPAWYMSQQEFSFSKGDKVVITGSRISYNNAPVLIAAMLQIGDMTLQLRDSNGFPRWRGWRMGKVMNN